VAELSHATRANPLKDESINKLIARLGQPQSIEA
jgi:hypothetical protein